MTLPIIISEKLCRNCNQVKPIAEFNRHKKYGTQNDCKLCQRQKYKEYRLKAKDKAKARQQRYYYKHHDRLKQKNRENKNRDYYLNPEKFRQYSLTRQRKHPQYFLFNSARKRARDKGLPFNITPEDINIPKYCPYLNIELSVGSGSMWDASPSLDRIDPKLGYVVGNIEVISYKANRIKNDSTITEMELILNRRKLIEK